MGIPFDLFGRTPNPILTCNWQLANASWWHFISAIWFSLFQKCTYKYCICSVFLFTCDEEVCFFCICVCLVWVRCVIIRKWWVTQCLLPELRSNEANKHQNNTRVSTETVRHQSIYLYLYLYLYIYILFHFLRVIMNPWITIKPRSLHIVLVSHSLVFCSADDVTIDCRWHHNDQTIVTRSREYWYLTRYILILFTVMMAGRVRNVRIATTLIYTCMLY